jgi:antitoxin component YwqK of YwqJK toxin-antitoxin module
MIDGRQGKVCRGWYANGRPEFEHGWVNDRYHGPDMRWDDRGHKLSERHWKDGYLHGRSAEWYTNGQLAEESHYDRYLFHGTDRTWLRTGQQRTQTDYRNGLREGTFVAWHPNGTKQCEANFTEDRLHGQWQEWDAKGKLLRKVDYRRGKIVAEKPDRRRHPCDYPGKLGAADFAFILAQGSGWHGFNTLRVSAAGRCEFTYFFTTPRVSGGMGLLAALPAGGIYIDQVWRQAEFQLTDDEQRQLRQALQAADVFGMANEYIDHDIADGTQWVIRLRARSKDKRVYCSNNFPVVLRQLSRTLRDQLMAPHQMELLTATRLDQRTPDPLSVEWLEDTNK